MATGTAILILGVLYLILGNHAFRMVSLGVLAICLGALAWAMEFGADKPQTWFYSPSDHPAFALRSGQVCPPDRHVWNGWCVK